MPKIPSEQTETVKRDTAPETLKPFLFHGLDLQHKKGAANATCDCVFCGREGKFNVRIDNSKFRCVTCGEEGNQYVFLRRLHEISTLSTTDKDFDELAENRKLLYRSTLVEWGICKSVVNKKWLVPGYNEKGALTNLYQYVFNGTRWLLLPTPTCSHAILGMNNYDPKKPVTAICEGVWDGACLYETLSKAKRGEEGYVPTNHEELSMLADKNVLAIPGALVFKENWLPLLHKQTVILMAQNDHPHKNEKTGKDSPPASYSGMERIAKMVLASKSVPTDLRLLSWGKDGYNKDFPSGYDVRDMLTSSGMALESRLLRLEALEAQISGIPLEWITDDSGASGGGASNNAGNTAARLKPLECKDYKTLITAWRKAMRWRQEMEDVLSTMLAVCASTVQVGDQLFLQVIGSAGGGKTKFCDALLVSDNCYPLEHLTGFHSGWKGNDGEDYSLITRMNRKTLITPEGDVIMSSPNFDQIMSEQRRIFDGTSGASFKNKKEDNRYTGLRTPWIMAGTPAMMDHDQSRLGDRFLKIIIDDPDDDERKAILLRCGHAALSAVMQTSNGEATKQLDSKYALAYQLTGGYVDYLRDNIEDLLSTLQTDADNLVAYCVELGEFTADLRARPDPEANRKDTTASKELATRLTHQFVRLACCLAVVLNKKTVDEEILRRVKKVALDTAKGVPLEILRIIRKYETGGIAGVEVKAVAISINRTEEKTRTMLRFMRDIGILRLSEPKPINGVQQKPRWYMTQRMSELYNNVMESE